MKDTLQKHPYIWFLLLCSCMPLLSFLLQKVSDSTSFFHLDEDMHASIGQSDSRILIIIGGTMLVISFFFWLFHTLGVTVFLFYVCCCGWWLFESVPLWIILHMITLSSIARELLMRLAPWQLGRYDMRTLAEGVLLFSLLPAWTGVSIRYFIWRPAGKK